jgi:two-component system cell cycle response regulator
VSTAPRIRRGVFALLFAGVAVHAALEHGGSVATADWLRAGIRAVAIGLLAWRAATKGELRFAWALVTFSTLLWAAADLVWSHAHTDTADVLYFSSYATGYPGLVLLLRGNMARPLQAWLALDGILAGLTVGALLAGAVYHSMQVSDAAVPLLTLGCDVLLLTTVAFAFAMSGWRPSAGWWVLGASQVLLAVLDAIEATGSVPVDGLLDSLWLLGFVLCCLAAWCPNGREHRTPTGWASAAAPIVGSALSIAVLVHAGLARDGALTVCLAGAALLVGIVRALLILDENFRLLHNARAEATTDKLTGLPNRRALVCDLDAASAAGRHTLAFFDLDGFKEYNDAFGHPAGDALLQRLAPALAAVGGRSYRLGGDEFCLLVEGALDEDHPQIRRAVDALTEHGDGFSIGASFGLVVLPDDATDATEAMLSRRPYKDVMAHADAVEELRRCAGSQFDPRLVEVVAVVAANLDTVVSG